MTNIIVRIVVKIVAISHIVVVLIIMGSLIINSQMSLPAFVLYGVAVVIITIIIIIIVTIIVIKPSSRFLFSVGTISHHRGPRHPALPA